jgi:hypothetical protein
MTTACCFNGIGFDVIMVFRGCFIGTTLSSICLCAIGFGVICFTGSGSKIILDLVFKNDSQLPNLCKVSSPAVSAALLS